MNRDLRHGLTMLAIVGTLVLTRPVAAQSGFPQPVDAAEAAVVQSIAEAMKTGEPNLSVLDGLLVRLPRPTPLRGMIQTARSALLLSADRPADAKASAEEAVRLSPGRAYPRMVASYVLTFAGAPEAAAAYWLEASVLEPDIARHSGEYELHALIGRLREVGNPALADRVETRMAEIGVLAAAAPSRSNAALARVRSAFTEGGAKAAQPMLSAILDPKDMMTLYVDRDYAALWPDIDTWAGARFERLHTSYLEELRREWWTTHGYDAAQNYARELTGARQYQAVVDLFLPMLSGEQARTYKPGMEFLTVTVGRSLVATGRRDEALAMFDRVAALMPREVEGLRLNLSGAVLTRLYESQDWNALIPRADAWIAIAHRRGPEVNTSAMLSVQKYRACALERAGRGTEAAMEAAIIEAGAANGAPALTLYACRNDFTSAKALVVRGLDQPGSRLAMLVMLQPETADPGEQPMTREIRLFNDRLRQDADVRKATDKVGRLLAYPVASTLPDDFDPLQTGPKAKPTPGSI